MISFFVPVDTSLEQLIVALVSVVTVPPTDVKVELCAQLCEASKGLTRSGATYRDFNLIKSLTSNRMILFEGCAKPRLVL